MSESLPAHWSLNMFVLFVIPEVNVKFILLPKSTQFVYVTLSGIITACPATVLLVHPIKNIATTSKLKTNNIFFILNTSFLFDLSR